MKPTWLSLMVCVALFTGCKPIESLNPIYSDNNIIFDKGLLGRWGIPGETDVLRLERGANNSYVMIYERTWDDGETKEVDVFDVHLVSLGGEKYFDIVSQTVTSWRIEDVANGFEQEEFSFHTCDAEDRRWTLY